MFVIEVHFGFVTQVCFYHNMLPESIEDGVPFISPMHVQSGLRGTYYFLGCGAAPDVLLCNIGS
jgi:hypothetical protein